MRDIVLNFNTNQMAIPLSIKVDQTEIKEKLDNLELKTDKQLTNALELLRKINSGVVSIDENSILMVKELVIPLINNKNRTKAERFVDYLGSSALSLPKEIVVELLASGLLVLLGLGA